MARMVPSDTNTSSVRSDSKPSPVVVGVWLGLVVAAVNLSVYAIKHYGLARIAFVSRDVWWTLPLTNAVVFGAIGLVIAAARLRSDARWLGAVFVCTAIGATSILLNYHALHPIAVVVLAAGIAVQVTRFAAKHRTLVHVTVRRTVGVLLVAAVATGVVDRGSRWWDERQTLRALKPPSTQVPNVLLIVLDTVRAANLSLYGYSRQTTPHLERFASGGVLFTSAFSTAPWTLPSHASMLTGRWESELSADWMRPLDEQFITLGEALEQRGYSTGAFVGNTVYVNSEVGLRRGFNHFESRDLRIGQLLNNDPLGQHLLQKTAFDQMVGLGPVPYCKKAPDVSQPFLEWAGRQTGPWFAMLNYFDAHEPYAPPTPFLQRFASADIHPNPKVDLEDPKAPWTEADAKEFVAAYDGGIAYLDAELGDIFAALERQGQLRNTVVIVTSDHGEEFGEHGWFGHGDSLYLPALHVPLIIVGPQGVPAGAVVSEPVSLRDIPATVLDLVDRTAREFPGQSLARYWNGVPAALSEDVIVAGVRRTIGQPASHPLSSGGAVALIDRRYHYVRYFGSGREQLFNFREDPWERSDLAGDPGAQAQIELFRRALQRVPGLDSLR